MKKIININMLLIIILIILTGVKLASIIFKYTNNL